MVKMLIDMSWALASLLFLGACVELAFYINYWKLFLNKFLFILSPYILGGISMVKKSVNVLGHCPTVMTADILNFELTGSKKFNVTFYS